MINNEELQLLATQCKPVVIESLDYALDCARASNLINLNLLHRYDHPSTNWTGGEFNEVVRKSLALAMKLLDEEACAAWKRALNEALNLSTLPPLSSDGVSSAGVPPTLSDTTKEENSSLPTSSQNST